jgi:hypothetical protein
MRLVMTTQSTPTAWPMTYNDLPDIENLLLIIIGGKTDPSTRLEIFARLAGHRTFKGLKSRLKNFSDLNGTPFPVYLDKCPVNDNEFFSDLPLSTRRHLVEIEETGLIQMVISGLNRSNHPLFGKLDLDENTTIADLRLASERLFHPASIDRSTIQINTNDNGAAIVVTPDNIENIRKKSSLPIEGSDCYAIYVFDFPETAAYPRLPSVGEIHTTKDPEVIAALLAGRKIYAYSTQDLFSIKSTIGNRLTQPAKFIQVKDAVTEIENLPPDTDLFTIGLIMECDYPESIEEAHPEDAMFWMIDILTFVHAYRLSFLKYSESSDLPSTASRH